MRRRRLLLLLVALVLLVGGGVAAVVVLTGGEDARTPEVLDGGSSFGGARERTNPGRAPLAGQEAQEASRPAEGLPLPPARAAARLMLVGFQGRGPRAPFFERLARRGWGGVVLERANFRDPEQLATLAREVAVVGRDAGVGVPLVAATQDGGEQTAFPSLPPAEASATPLPAAAGRQARLAGRRLRAAGVHLTFAPVASIGAAGGPWEGRAFGDRAGAVATATVAAVDGWRAGGVAAVAGRFPGEGAASQDPAAGTASVGLGLPELQASDIVPFATIARRAAAIQMSPAVYAAFDGVTPATLLPDAFELLREDVGFRGVVISADLSSTTLATGTSVAEAAVEALKAGCDLIWVPGDVNAQEEAYRALVRAIRSGAVPAGRVRGALERISTLKREFRIR